MLYKNHVIYRPKKFKGSRPVIEAKNMCDALEASNRLLETCLSVFENSGRSKKAQHIRQQQRSNIEAMLAWLKKRKEP